MRTIINNWKTPRVSLQWLFNIRFKSSSFHFYVQIINSPMEALWQSSFIVLDIYNHLMVLYLDWRKGCTSLLIIVYNDLMIERYLGHVRDWSIQPKQIVYVYVYICCFYASLWQRRWKERRGRQVASSQQLYTKYSSVLSERWPYLQISNPTV